MIKYSSIISLVFSVLFLMYTFLDPNYKELINAFILRILLFSKAQILYIFNVISREIFIFFWGVIVMQFGFAFIFGGIKKFILMSLSSKLILLIISLGKRYIIDNVVMVSLNNNFINHIKKPIAKLVNHYLLLIKELSVKKRIAIWAAAVGIPFIIITPILYFVGIFTFLLEKIFSANLWKAILLWFLKIITVFFTFFSNIWDSWFAPILEVILFTWILGILEKIPFLGKVLRPIYVFFNKFILGIKSFLDKYFHKKMQKTLGKVISKINYHTDITILKSENKKYLKKCNKKQIKILTRYINSTNKIKRNYKYHKRLNAHLLNQNTQSLKYFGKRKYK